LHPLAIAFENLSPFLGIAVNLDITSLQDKLVKRKRGGYCYEHNLLFSHVLKALGFDVTGLAARVRWNVTGQTVLPRTHMLLLVNIEDVNYIADVGFGGLTLTAPLRLDSGLEQATPHESFRIVYSEGAYTLQANVARTWKALYSFDLQEQHQPDYELTNWYVSNYPQSRFVRELIVARPAQSSRHALLNNQYTVHQLAGKAQKRTIVNSHDLVETLGNEFDIQIDDIPDVRLKLSSLFT
jgi:N-hydroxyarylamine O-acetyltransferase